MSIIFAMIMKKISFAKLIECFSTLRSNTSFYIDEHSFHKIKGRRE